MPVELDGDEIGVVECGGRRNGSALNDDDVAVVGTLARPAAMAVRDVRLTSQLRARWAGLIRRQLQRMDGSSAETVDEIEALQSSAGYFTVGETLANSLKHSKADRVMFDCRHTEESLSITMNDDGVGFDPSTTDRHGNGLVNITELVAAIDGRLTVDASPGGGTRVTIVLPTVSHPLYGAIT